MQLRVCRVHSHILYFCRDGGFRRAFLRRSESASGAAAALVFLCGKRRASLLRRGRAGPRRIFPSRRACEHVRRGGDHRGGHPLPRRGKRDRQRHFPPPRASHLRHAVHGGGLSSERRPFREMAAHRPCLRPVHGGGANRYTYSLVLPIADRSRGIPEYICRLCPHLRADDLRRVVDPHRQADRAGQVHRTGRGGQLDGRIHPRLPGTRLGA